MDHLAQRRLGNIQFLGCCGVVSILCNLYEIFQLTNFHKTVLSLLTHYVLQRERISSILISADNSIYEITTKKQEKTPSASAQKRAGTVRKYIRQLEQLEIATARQRTAVAQTSP